jgi:hypothetical protein
MRQVAQNIVRVRSHSHAAARTGGQGQESCRNIHPDNGTRRAIAARLACDYESWARAEMNGPGSSGDHGLLKREPVHGKGA